MALVTIGETESGGSFKLSQSGLLGQTRLTAEAPGFTTLLTAGLAGYLAAVQTGSPLVRRSSGRAVSIRAEASTSGELFAGLIAATLDRLEALEIAASIVRIDGVVRSDSGRIAWGQLEIADVRAGNRRSLSVAAAPIIVEVEGRYTLEVLLDRG